MVLSAPDGSAGARAAAMDAATRERVLGGAPPAEEADVGSLEWRDDVGAGHPALAALVRAHREDLARHSPACSVHALGPEAFTADPALTLLSAWHGETLVACGALKRHRGALGELKTMRVVDAWRGRGVGDALLERLIGRARTGGCSRLALETGGGAPFAAAHAFYTRHGFVPCPPFADYRDDPFSVYLARAL